MTKKIRIENADTSNYKVVVQVWDKYKDGDKMVREIKLDQPCLMIDECITNMRYLVIKEI